MHHILTGRIRLIHCTNHGKNIPYMHCFISVCNPNLVSLSIDLGLLVGPVPLRCQKFAFFFFVHRRSLLRRDIHIVCLHLVAVYALRIALYYHIYCSIGYRASIVFHHQSKLPDVFLTWTDLTRCPSFNKNAGAIVSTTGMPS
jgi:hypothetical protein